MVAEEADLFYAYDVLIASTNPMLLQCGFDVLISIFEKVGIRTNMAKMVEMVC